MTWNVRWSKKALKELGQIASRDVDRILQSTEYVLEEPAKNLEKPTNSPMYKYRVGDCRVVADVIHNQQLLLAIRVRKRARAYG